MSTPAAGVPMQTQFIPLAKVARAIPCSEETVRQWLARGHIEGRDSFGRMNTRITSESVGVVVSVASLTCYCERIGIAVDGLNSH